MTRDMALYLAGQRVPRPSTFKKVETINGVDVKTLGGVTYTDFRDRSRTWVLTWENILYDTDHLTLTNVWRDQIRTRTYPMLTFASENLYVPVKMDISEQNIRYNGTLVESFTVTLTEQNPVS